MPSKEEFYNSITEDMDLNKDFLKKLYGYSLYDNDFLVRVMEKFTNFGRCRVAAVYTVFSMMEKEKENRELAPVARWLKEKIDRDFDKSVKEYNRKQGDEKRKSQKTNLSRAEVATEILKW